MTTAAAAGALFGRYPEYRSVLSWLDEFVLRPHPSLGRPGPVCPLLRTVLRDDLMWLTVAHPAAASPEDATDLAEPLADLFDHVAAGPRRRGALLVLFPALPAEHAAGFIDEGHRRMRPAFLARGLMLGEFHPGSVVGSVHNAGLPVMRSPVPMFAVRAMHHHDVVFLDRPGDPVGARHDDLDLYRRHIGTIGGSEQRPGIRDPQARATTTVLSGGNR